MTKSSPSIPCMDFFYSRSKVKKMIFSLFSAKRAKNHYGDLLKKAKHDKEFIRVKREKELDYSSSVRQEFIIYISAFICICFVALASYGKSEYDTDTTQKDKNKTTQSGSVKNS